MSELVWIALVIGAFVNGFLLALCLLFTGTIKLIKNGVQIWPVEK